jgi:hypothetical protein
MHLMCRVACKHCGPSCAGDAHESKDACIAAMKLEIDILRRAIAMLTLGSSESLGSPPHDDGLPSGSPKKPKK